MKLEDVMLGDLVYANKKPIHVTVATLKLMIEDEKFAESLQPIPLTPEVLEKNGFKYNDWYGWQIKEPDFTLCFVGGTPHFLLDEIFVCDCPPAVPVPPSML